MYGIQRTGTPASVTHTYLLVPSTPCVHARARHVVKAVLITTGGRHPYSPGRMDGETGGNSTENGRQAPSDELGSEVIGGRKRPQRGIQGAQYDETRRRKRRRNHGAVRPYMDRASNGYTRIGAKRNAIEVGAAILTRAAAGEYEWRDAGMGPVKRQRRGDTRQEKDSARDEDKDGQ